MRILTLSCFLLLSASADAQVVISDNLVKDTLAWSHDCEDSGKTCWLEKIVEFRSQSGMEHGGLAVFYDTVSKQPELIAVILPKDVPAESEVLIRFVDSVKKDGKWTLVPADKDFIALPLSGCDPESCQARVHARIPEGPNLFDEIQKRNHLWVVFKRNNALERFMVPLDAFGEELKGIK